MPHGTIARLKPRHVITIYDIWHLCYVRACHMAHWQGLSHGMWHVATLYDMPCGTYAMLGHDTWHIG